MLRIYSIAVVMALLLTVTASTTRGGQVWRDSFTPNRSSLVDSGKAAYFVLDPGYRLRFAHGKDTLTITVLAETRLAGSTRPWHP